MMSDRVIDLSQLTKEEIVGLTKSEVRGIVKRKVDATPNPRVPFDELEESEINEIFEEMIQELPQFKNQTQPVNNNDPPPPKLDIKGYDDSGVVDFKDPNANKYVKPAGRPPFEDTSTLSEEEARHAYAQFASEHCCWGKGPVQDLKFTNLKQSNGYRYVLESFVESRTTKQTFLPYNGEVVVNDGRPPPQPWDIAVQPEKLFVNHKHMKEIPNTALVKPCHTCTGSGKIVCGSCAGQGRSRCGWCMGRGNKHNPQTNQMERCNSCYGSGFTNCGRCSATGRVTCTTCQGRCSLKWFYQLEVDFKNVVETYAKDYDATFPDELLVNCPATVMFNEVAQWVYQVDTHPDPDINMASQRMLAEHRAKFSNCRILMQKHAISSIPMTLCSYIFKEKPYKFHVYGTDHKVYDPNYPTKCCCCTIL